MGARLDREAVPGLPDACRRRLWDGRALARAAGIHEVTARQAINGHAVTIAVKVAILEALKATPPSDLMVVMQELEAS